MLSVRRLRCTLLAKTLGAKLLSRAARLRASSLGVDDVSGAPARCVCLHVDLMLLCFCSFTPPSRDTNSGREPTAGGLIKSTGITNDVRSRK